MISNSIRKKLILLGLFILTVGLSSCAIVEGVGDELVRACAQPEFNPTKFEDTNDGICTTSDCSLREAVITANACEGEDVINLNSGTYTIYLRDTTSHPPGFDDLVVTDDLTIRGDSDAVIDGELVITGEATQVSLLGFNLHSLRNEGVVNAQELITQNIDNEGTFTGTNIDVVDGSGIVNSGEFSILGGNILRNSRLAGIGDSVQTVFNMGGRMSISDVLIAENTVRPEYEDEYPNLFVLVNDNGELRVNDSIIRDNNPPFGNRGAGIYVIGGSLPTVTVLDQVTISGHDSFAVVNGFSHVDIVDSTIINNAGGALLNDTDSSIHVSNSLMAWNGNQGRLSGACATVFNYGELLIENSTITASVDNDSGCATIENWTQLSLDSVTIFENALPAILDQAGGSPTTRIERSILAQNGGGNCISSVLTSAGLNLFDDDTCAPMPSSGDIVDTSGVLGIEPLADNGGPTWTHALLATSPGVDTGGDRCLTTDQRGVIRPQDGNGDGTDACDLGAFELDPSGDSSSSSPEIVEGTPAPTSTSEPTATPLGPITVNFNADTYALVAGECTRLRWEVNNAETVSLDGVSVPSLEAEQVCPKATTTYTMVASNAVETVERFVTIEVTIPVALPETPAQLGITNQVCSAQSYQVTLSWIDVADNEDGYRVFRDGNLISTLGPNAKGFTDSPPFGGPYIYGVEAFNSAGASSQPTVQEPGCIY